MFTLIRHGETDYQIAEDRRLRGAARDWVPLTERGVTQVESAVETLRGRTVDLILSSPMTRAVQTAAILSRRLSVDLKVEFDLHEWLPDLGFQYENAAEAIERGREAAALGGEWPAGESRPWEPYSRLRRRVEAVLRRYAGRGHVLVACHGTVIATLTGKQVGTAETVPYQLPGRS